MYKNLKNVIKYPSPEANASTSPARGKVKKYRLLFSNNRFSLAKIRIMSLMQNKIFSQCTNQYISTKYTNSKIANSSVDSVKIRREKILAYTEVREFSLFRSFSARCAARCDFYIWTV